MAHEIDNAKAHMGAGNCDLALSAVNAALGSAAMANAEMRAAKADWQACKDMIGTAQELAEALESATAV